MDTENSRLIWMFSTFLPVWKIFFKLFTCYQKKLFAYIFSTFICHIFCTSRFFCSLTE